MFLPNAGWAFGTITLPWSTSFTGCSADQLIPVGETAVCGTNNMVAAGGYDACTPSSGGIYSDANYPGGGGERGWRRWTCGPTGHGHARGTGYLWINLNSEPEIWVRFYTRWQVGSLYSASGARYAKLVYIRPFGSGLVMDLIGADKMSMTVQSGRGKTGAANIFACRSGCGWNTLNPNGSPGAGANNGDGSWHAIEFHFKDQSGTGTYDGVWDLWIDGIQKTHQTGIQWYSGAPTGVRSLQFMVNQTFPMNTDVPRYNDVDDIAISKTGYIGLIAGPTGTINVTGVVSGGGGTILSASKKIIHETRL